MRKLDRQQVYQKIWSVPIAELSRQYGFSEQALRRICMQLNIPLPVPNYWRKLRTGKPVRRLPLPDTDGPEIILVDDVGNKISQEPYPECTESPEPEPTSIGSQPDIPFVQSDRQLSEPPAQEVAHDETSHDFQMLIEQERAFEASPKNRITVAKVLRNPDPLVILTERALKQGVKDMRGIIVPSHGAKSLNVRVSKCSIHRALCIIDALVKGLAVRHFKITFDKHAYRGVTIATVHIYGESVEFQITEKTTRSERPLAREEKIDLAAGPAYIPHRYSYIPTGILKLSVSDRLGAAIEDRKGRPLEDRLNEFILLLVQEVVRCKRQRQERRQREEAYRCQQALKYAREHELMRFEAVERMAMDWRRAADIRHFLDTLESAIISSAGSLDPNHEVAQWIKWGRQMADSIDPIALAKKKGRIEIKR